jgi:hypothetical protein
MKRLVRARTSALRLMFRPVPVMKDLCVDQAARRAPMAEICRNFLGMIRRVLTRKL